MFVRKSQPLPHLALLRKVKRVRSTSSTVLLTVFAFPATGFATQNVTVQTAVMSVMVSKLAAASVKVVLLSALKLVYVRK